MSSEKSYRPQPGAALPGSGATRPPCYPCSGPDRSRRVTRAPSAAFALLLATAGCAADPAAGYLPVPAAELTRLVAGNSLLLDATADWPMQTLLYLAPGGGGGGWRDARLRPGAEPQPGDMAMVLAWQATDEGGLCVWSTPLIGLMPSFLPPQQDCLLVLRAPTGGEALMATATDPQRSVTAPLYLRSGNSFPPGQIAQYEVQVRVLFGGQLPRWRIP